MAGQVTPRIQRIGYAIITGMFAIGASVGFGAKLAHSSIVAIAIFFAASWGLLYLIWDWIFVTRPQQVKKNVPITSKEWRRRQKNFYDSLRRR